LNAEICSGTITNLKDGVIWLQHTYLVIRMQKNPQLYGMSEESSHKQSDPFFIHRLTNLIHSGAIILDKNGLVKYDRSEGTFKFTTLGKIASYFYIKYPSISIYNDNIKPNMSLIDLFRLFSMSSEFKFIPVREEEKIELQRLYDQIPIPIKGSLEDYTSKVNILVQSYICKLNMEGLAIISDMVYVQ
jgi:pre-mRNA-splicing helicase BRR2